MMWFLSWKVKGQGPGHRVNKCIFHTNYYYAYVDEHLTDNSNTAWIQTMTMIVFYLLYILT